MAKQTATERLRRAVADASARLASPANSPGPTPGNLYTFPGPADAAVEWVVVRPHPDDPALVLLAPVDEFPLVGRADVPLEPAFSNRPLTVRCGESAWVPTVVCADRWRVGAVPDEAVAAIRRTLAALVRGQPVGRPESARVDADPEYEAWVGRVAQAREALERRAESDQATGGTVLRFDELTARPPAALEVNEVTVLAARSSGPLLASLAESLAADPPRYTELPRAGGTLLIAADAAGVCVAWQGDAPPPLSVGDVAVAWRAGSTPDLYRAEPAFAWDDGQVVLVVGSPPETITVRL